MLLLGDCLEQMKTLEDGSIDAIVTDPPYGLGFMGKDWDHAVPGAPYWEEALRVAKPGAHLLCFGGTRTFHRMACAIEDAGWEIRDTIMWVYGSGFPKSMDVSKAIDKSLDAKRKETGVRGRSGSKRNCMAGDFTGGEYMNTEPATEQASEWQGWGTCLKPAWEPVIVARKPLDGTVAHNVMEYGTGAINIDACRVGIEQRTYKGMSTKQPNQAGVFRDDNWVPKDIEVTVTGRFPANLIHDGSDEVTEPMGSAARFFYCAKASKRERGEDNNHPTVKPQALMEYLVTMVTREGAVVLDPFMGSGSTGVACSTLGREFVGIELDPAYYDIAKRRIEAA